MWRYTSVRRVIVLVISLSITLTILTLTSLFLSTRNSFEENISLTATRVVCSLGKPLVTLSWQNATGTTISLQRRMTTFEKANDLKGVILSNSSSTLYTDAAFDDSYAQGIYYYRAIILKKEIPVAFSEVISVAIPLCTLKRVDVDMAITATSVDRVPSKNTPIRPTTTSEPKAPPLPAKASTSLVVIKSSSSPPVVQSSTAIQAHTAFPSWMKWGAYVGWQPNNMSAFESLVGKAPQLEAVFSHWGNDDFPTIYNERVRDKGRTLVIFWEAVDYTRPYFNQPEYSFDSVINGSLDAYFIRYAKDAKQYSGEIILIPYSEFNGDWYPWAITIGDNTPEKFRAAWVHIHTIFKQTGATNVKFGWAPNGTSVPDTSENNFELYYPGSQYVDVVGVDIFNFNNDWMSFDQMGRDTLLKMRKYGKPTYVFSLGAAENSKKASWITETFTKTLYQYPEIKGWIWFNENKEEDWRVNSSQASLEAFKKMLP